ncbi:hypothetical protein Salat_1617000 [Sesamum alatum]|uniref:Uncharacterized protein n=1 Tax=Sesamum alatum TaxID=300844 RepID=A0AAE2CJA1_9LAMI|nr:hypothetical protein Salat_1617000 [Sesamum alatum]
MCHVMVGPHLTKSELKVGRDEGGQYGKFVLPGERRTRMAHRWQLCSNKTVQVDPYCSTSANAHPTRKLFSGQPVGLRQRLGGEGAGNSYCVRIIIAAGIRI